MKVILTNRFKNEYLKPLLKYFTKEDLVKHLKERNHTLVPLHLPFFKLKNKINNFAFRGIVVVIKNETIIPVMIFTKKDKKYGDNIRWDSYEKFILDEYDKILEDIDTKNGEEKRFEEF